MAQIAHKSKVLIITKDKDEALILEKKLIAEEIQLQIIDEGLKGISTIEHEKFKLVIIDSSIDDMIAIEVCSLIRYDNPSSRLPILIIFQEKEKEDFDKMQETNPAFEVSFDTYFRPIELDILIKHIKQLVYF